HRDAHEIEHHRGDVHHVIRPVAPAGEEAVEIAEFPLGPQIHAAFPRIAMSKLNHGNSLRPEKKNQRNQPKPNGDAAVRRDAGHHIEIEYGDNEERHQVPAPQRPLQVWGGILRGLILSQTKLQTQFPASAPRSTLRAALFARPPAPEQLPQMPADGDRCPRPYAPPKSSIARPTNTAAESRRDSSSRTSSAARDRYRSSTNHGNCESASGKTSAPRSRPR